MATPTLSPCQQDALRILEDSAENVFLTGHAGTGKSHLVKYFLRGRDRKAFPVVASTGVAAVLTGGRTFHSFFGLGIMEGGFERTVERALGDRKVVKRLRAISGFVLDEVSMIPGSALSAAESICRLARQKQLPWGGARVVAVGDFSQLPPVAANGSAREWAFLDEAWRRSDFSPVVLRTVMRTEDADYLNVLNRVREGVVDDDVRTYLNRRVDPDSCEESTATFLTPTRVLSDRQNRKRLAEIEHPLHEFVTQYSGRERAVEQLKKNAPVTEVVSLKKTARVMIRVNDPAYQFVNGSVGTVEDVSNMTLTVKLANGKIIELEKHAFSLLDAEGNEIATAVNFPVSLAYAMTIHKSQGVTLDRMVVDLRRLWEPGQAYVALSRLRSGSGLILAGWDEGSIRVDPQVAAFQAGLSQ